MTLVHGGEGDDLIMLGLGADDVSVVEWKMYKISRKPQMLILHQAQR